MHEATALGVLGSLSEIEDNRDTYTKSMKIQLQYLNDQEGNLKAVQIPIEEWEKLERILKKYEQTLQVKEDLLTAFDEVRQIRAGKIPKQTLSDFLDEL
jgi:hypothetical protein